VVLNEGTLGFMIVVRIQDQTGSLYLPLHQHSDIWRASIPRYMDGTFDSAPLQFQELYVIRAPPGDSAASCVYAFLPNKT